jgi:DNA-binding transcriptional regulator PaaX
VGIHAEVLNLEAGGLVAVDDDDFPGWSFRVGFAPDRTVTTFDVERPVGSAELTRTALKGLPFGAYEREARRALYELADAWRRGVQLSPEAQAAEAEERYWTEKYAAAGLHPPNFHVRSSVRIAETHETAPTRQRERSRSTRTEYWSAVLARRYVELHLADADVPIYRALVDEYGLSEQSVRNAVRQLRKDGYLTPTIRGRQGGELTEKSRRILEQGEE